MRYPLTFYWAKGVGKGAAATTRICFIFIKPEYKDDEGLYRHELLHVKQWAFTTLVSGLMLAAINPVLAGLSIGVFGLLYTSVPDLRLWCEVEAYDEQLKYYADDRREKFAGFICDHYGLDVSRIEVFNMFTNRV